MTPNTLTYPITALELVYMNKNKSKINKYNFGDGMYTGTADGTPVITDNFSLCNNYQGKYI